MACGNNKITRGYLSSQPTGSFPTMGEILFGRVEALHRRSAHDGGRPGSQPNRGSRVDGRDVNPLTPGLADATSPGPKVKKSDASSARSAAWSPPTVPPAADVATPSMSPPAGTKDSLSDARILDVALSLKRAQLQAAGIHPNSSRTHVVSPGDRTGTARAVLALAAEPFDVRTGWSDTSVTSRRRNFSEKQSSSRPGEYYSGGIDEPDGPGHGHYRREPSGEIVTIRGPVDPLEWGARHRAHELASRLRATR